MLFLAAQSAATHGGAGAPLALLVLIAAMAAWIALRAVVRRFQVRKAEAVVHSNFTEFALEALVNAARLDRRVAGAEREAVLEAMREIGGAEFDLGRVESALGAARLSKDELVAYLEEKARGFPQTQKVQFLKALLGVLVADGRFDESEHHALVQYAAAVGFDRESAPQVLRGLLSDMARGRIT